MKSHYDTLGLKRDAQPSQIKKAYRKKALQWHPDKNTESRAFALEQFHEVNEAYNTLSKSHLKCVYDCKLMEQESLVELFKLIQQNEQREQYFNYEMDNNTNYLSQEDNDILNKFKKRMNEPIQTKKRIRKTV